MRSDTELLNKAGDTLFSKKKSIISRTVAARSGRVVLPGGDEATWIAGTSATVRSQKKRGLVFPRGAQRTCCYSKGEG
jgi:hypothetical protein